MSNHTYLPIITSFGGHGGVICKILSDFGAPATKIDVFCTVQHLTSILKFFKLIFSFNLKLRYAVEISDQKIPKFEKFRFSTFTGKKNQGFWTRIDNFRNYFKTLAYPDVTWTVSLSDFTSHRIT